MTDAPTAAPTATAPAAASSLERSFPLANSKGRKPRSPAWFKAALAAPQEDASLKVAGATIRWRRWGKAGKPGLLFVHGGLAHLGWWDFIAPFFVDDFSPVALSLSGMGGSDWRERYPVEGYADEVLAVAEASGLAAGAAKPILVGHSFGGFISILAAAQFGKRLAGAVVIDTPVKPPREEGGGVSRRRGGRIYADEAEALARFSLLPDQPCENLFLVDHVARGALRPGPGGAGVAWAHDPDIWPKTERPKKQPLELLQDIACPLAFIRGQNSALVTDEVWAMMGQIFGPDTPRTTIPEAAHHVMLDQPLALVAALRTLLSVWPTR